MKTQQILSWTGRVLFSCEVEDGDPNPMRTAVTRANLTGANLTRADLAGADLAGANLAGANLAGADLTRANLTRANPAGANLAGANLAGANLTRADLAGADLAGANLAGANLTRADLAGANLTRADLAGANLTRADLAGADLAGAEADFLLVLAAAPNEAVGLLAAVREGRIDGSRYEGQCACLIGTIGNLRGQRHDRMPGLKPDSSRPIERLFMGISPGHVPAINPVAKIVEGWLVEWIAQHGGAA